MWGGRKPGKIPPVIQAKVNWDAEGKKRRLEERSLRECPYGLQTRRAKGWTSDPNKRGGGHGGRGSPLPRVLNGLNKASGKMGGLQALKLER